MRDVVVNTWCDVCHHEHGRKVPGESVVIGFDGKWQSVDLCNTCAVGLIGPVRILVIEHGVDPEPGKASARPTTPTGTRRGPEPKRGRPWKCPHCVASYSTSQSLCKHAQSTHKAGGSSVLHVFGSTCPACGSALGDARNRHAQTVHGAENISQVWAGLLASGQDPHGVIAAWRKALPK